MSALIVRQENPEEASEIARLIRAAFDRTNGEEVALMSEIRNSADRFVPALTLVAEQEGRLVGQCVCSLGRLTDGEGSALSEAVLILGPISVWPNLQRQGIGSALILRTLELAATRAESMIVLFGHPEYYPRFGFRPAREYGLFPDGDAAMVYPLKSDLNHVRGLHLPA